MRRRRVADGLVVLRAEGCARPDARRLEFPDFTRGSWKTNRAPGIVDVEKAKLPMR